MNKNEVESEINDEVLVMFPASKNFANVESQNPVPNLKNELEKTLTFNERTKLEVPSELDNLTQACHSLDVRLKVLEEVRDRLKFYLDDLETELLKK